MASLFKKNTFTIKIKSWEYWPMWILYVPVFIQHFWLAIKARSLFFFLNTNPGIEGFILSDSKYKTLKLVPREFVPKTILVRPESSFEEVYGMMGEEQISFPIVLKPDIGYRGLLVSKIDNQSELKEKLKNANINYVIQEYIDYPIEIGVFYYRLPNNISGSIPSVTLKDFLSLHGDGQRTFQELVYTNSRAYLQKDKLEEKFRAEWGTVIPKGKTILLEAIGNHNRGTKFINGNHLITENLQQVFDELCKSMNGFYFGRFDIRTRSIEDLLLGREFKVLEVNGIGAEPTHIYDPEYKLYQGWKDMLSIWKISYEIAMVNRKKGAAFPKYAEAKRRWDSYRDYKRNAFLASS
ncbi:hypothetical protein SAMN04487906_0588 [Zhouia amylolytica]|uniref:Biotin carboxylase n=2 Tax=Zhouia amylolytica TaxID=376730 RepID=W2UQ18_9FLAO|nr:hypothetical protein [Zhouia amylolytica]ETN96049.1 biotin carboxylase [Zhouia amylolytica AD3]MCQ0111335.1 D-alanine--D-alanine ligase [Zhouia amylolytica]SFS50242.1 hypothetical protein SAMN04487906_0588 [Zhouia amylolytica]